MTLRSTHHPEFAGMPDTYVLQQYTYASKARRGIQAAIDMNVGTTKWLTTWETAINVLDKYLFKLDDELCARDLDLPKIEE